MMTRHFAVEATQSQLAHLDMSLANMVWPNAFRVSTTLKESHLLVALPRGIEGLFREIMKIQVLAPKRPPDLARLEPVGLLHVRLERLARRE
jgi:hypothetical protein